MSLSVEDLQSAYLRSNPPAQPRVAPGPNAPTSPTEPFPEPSPAMPVCHVVDHKSKGCHLEITVAPDRVVAAAQFFDEQGFVIDAVTGVDWMSEGQMEVIYDFFHLTAPLHALVRTRVPRDNPELPTISTIFPGANWHERETHDMLGIRFSGHPDLSPLLLPEDATYHPLRKDFTGAA
jgi:NADH-quinone oxidoreductase subunit C